MAMDRVPFLISLLAFGAVLSGSTSLAQKPKPSGPETALIAGTVFRDPGFALPGAEILLEPNPEDKPSVKGKVKKMKAQSDSRGEYSFRVPAAPMRYTLRFQAAGFVPETRQIAISGPERQDVYATLKAAKGGSQ